MSLEDLRAKLVSWIKSVREQSESDPPGKTSAEAAVADAPAAPEAAVEGAAEELDIPPPRRVELDTEGPEGHVGAGHLRAAGLRL